MNIDELQKAIEYEYKERNIKKRRYIAFNKVIAFFKHTFQCTDDVNFIIQIKKEKLKQIYKATNNAESQAINDVYNYLTNKIIEKTLFHKSEIKDLFPQRTDKHLKKGLPPWVGKNPKVLILGSMPSDVSIEKQLYYANTSRNSFWKIMYSLLPKEIYKSDKEYITSYGIALWDCCNSAVREGSMDCGFDDNTIVPNDLQSFLDSYPSINTIVINGKGKPALYYKRFFSNIEIENLFIMNSTSNACVMSFKDKQKEWKFIIDLLK